LKKISKFTNYDFGIVPPLWRLKLIESMLTLKK